MKILSINAGSSSIKYKLFLMQGDTPPVMAEGRVERIGEDTGDFSHTSFKDSGEVEIKSDAPVQDHEQGMNMVIDALTSPEHGVIASVDEIHACGHRIVHGGSYTKSCLVDDVVIKELEDTIPLAPLHNPGHLTGIRVAMKLMPKAPQVVVFDTAFHQTMPEEAYMYPVPYEMYEKYRVRRYGFHGTSHHYVSKLTAKSMGRPVEELNMITAHIGNGSSLAAVKNGKCVDTSMGLTPLAGVMMGTRTGDVDPAVVFYVGKQTGKNLDELNSMFNHESGLKGICGKNDLRDVHALAKAGDEKAKLAVNMLCYTIKRFVGAYVGILGRVDAITFTAGVGENDPIVRGRSLAGLEHLGIVIDEKRNDGRFGEPTRISADDSKVQVWVVPTNEELEIANQTVQTIS